MRMLVFCILLVSQLTLPSIGQQLASTGQSATAPCTFDDGKQVTVQYNSLAAKNEERLRRGKPWEAGGSSMILFTQTRLRLRAVSESGVRGDWQPLAKLVRIPSLKEVRCPDSPDKPCNLIGQNLFLIDSVASDSQFAHNIVVPTGFADSALSVPRPNGTLLFIKLRDDPSAITKAALAVLPEP
ncbi:MAG: hypothetical protein WCC89_06925 [Candidatus Sulfotelmatobacter sp.]